METQKNVNLLNDSNYEDSKFATKKWYIIDSEVITYVIMKLNF